MLCRLDSWFISVFRVQSSVLCARVCLLPIHNILPRILSPSLLFSYVFLLSSPLVWQTSKVVGKSESEWVSERVKKRKREISLWTWEWISPNPLSSIFYFPPATPSPSELCDSSSSSSTYISLYQFKYTKKVEESYSNIKFKFNSNSIFLLAISSFVYSVHTWTLNII